jgi:hypothetical protein
MPRRFAEAVWEAAQVGHRLTWDVRKKTSSLVVAGTVPSSDQIACENAVIPSRAPGTRVKV